MDNKDIDQLEGSKLIDDLEGVFEEISSAPETATTAKPSKFGKQGAPKEFEVDPLAADIIEMTKHVKNDVSEAAA